MASRPPAYHADTRIPPTGERRRSGGREKVTPRGSMFLLYVIFILAFSLLLSYFPPSFSHSLHSSLHPSPPFPILPSLYPPSLASCLYSFPFPFPCPSLTPTLLSLPHSIPLPSLPLSPSVPLLLHSAYHVQLLVGPLVQAGPPVQHGVDVREANPVAPQVVRHQVDGVQQAAAERQSVGAFEQPSQYGQSLFEELAILDSPKLA